MQTLQETEVPFCPRCFTAVGDSDGCTSCGLEFIRRGTLLDVIGVHERETRAQEVEGFYTKNPFPGYAPGDDGPTLLDRSRRSSFLRALDEAIPSDGPVVDCGCGTAQLASFLALAGPRRTVIGVDGCRESLTHANEFRERAKIRNLQLVRGDLFDLPLERDKFPVVISRGVVHHTPDPPRAIAEVAARVEPGGVLLMGFYETMGRLFHCTRRKLSKVRGKPIRWMDPILRRRDLDEEKKRIWIMDQYEHPLEHILPMPGVMDQLRDLGFDWIRTVPPSPASGNMFDATPEPSKLGKFFLRLGWTLQGLNDPDAGLVFVIARRRKG